MPLKSQRWPGPEGQDLDSDVAPQPPVSISLHAESDEIPLCGAWSLNGKGLRDLSHLLQLHLK